MSKTTKRVPKELFTKSEVVKILFKVLDIPIKTINLYIKCYPELFTITAPTKVYSCDPMIDIDDKSYYDGKS
jgi:hypothetical protein